jgi:hypothetical protein
MQFRDVLDRPEAGPNGGFHSPTVRISKVLKINIHQFEISYKRDCIIPISDREIEWCLEPDGNGVNPGRGNGRGPGPPNGEQDKQLTANRGGDNSLMGQRGGGGEE